MSVTSQKLQNQFFANFLDTLFVIPNTDDISNDNINFPTEPRQIKTDIMALKSFALEESLLIKHNIRPSSRNSQAHHITVVVLVRSSSIALASK